MAAIKRKRGKEPPVNFSKRLFDLKADGTFCDVQLHLHGSILLAHACVLASCSSLFLELFKLNQAIHWCARNPLVIDLEKLFDNSKDLCAICVSKIIDFMYVRELVILQGHYEHFVVISNSLHLFDFIPPGKNCNKTISLETNSSRTFNFQSSATETVVDKQKNVKINNKATTDLLSKQAPCVKSPNGCPTSNHSSTKQLEPVASEDGCGGSKAILNSTVISKVGLKSESIVYPCNNSSSNSVNLKNKKKNCEFMCCKPEPEVNSCSAKRGKRRIMFCKVCDYSSVSIRRLLHHIQSSEHFHGTCPVCLREISNDSFKEHVKDHANAKPFICHICNKRNRYWYYYKMHLKLHCQNKSFYCDLCQRGFWSKRSMKEHLNSHKGSYLCKTCDYYTSDFDKYKLHLFEHEKIQSINLNTKKFQCQVCEEGFTLKRNLARHMKLKHFDAMKFECSLCAFTAIRIDILGVHMKKKHSCTLLNEKRKSLSNTFLKNNNEKPNEFVSVMIPVQLVSDHSGVNSLISESNERDMAGTTNTKCINSQINSFSNTDSSFQNTNLDFSLYVESEVIVDNSIEHQPVAVSSDDLHVNRAIIKLKTFGEVSNKVDQDINSKSISSSIKAMSASLEMKATEKSSQVMNGTDFDNGTVKNTTVENGEQYIWLNETTGELLNDVSFISMQPHNLVSKAQQKFSDSTTLDYCDIQSSVLNETSAERSALEFMDETEEWQLPQTPQTSMVSVDESENIFPWNQIDSSFYSTWVLNETTGELNMVSFFSIQSVRNPSELKLGEESKPSISLEDDDTALFLNEGTGDLSVIYFKPSGLEKNELNISSFEKLNPDNQETRSEISDDDSDWLNEEFMRVSANFMSNEENERFLNELTGEFDIANLNNYQPDVFNTQVSGNESYLNEETGEISWNIMDNNENDDLFTKPDGLEYDLDDSLNCEDFEPFFRDVSGFSSQFCLDEGSKTWLSADEASDALVLNECTGELVKKS